METFFFFDFFLHPIDPKDLEACIPSSKQSH